MSNQLITLPDIQPEHIFQILTKKNLYPLYSGFMRANLLEEHLLQEMGEIENLDNEQKINHFLVPGIYNPEQLIDSNLYLSSIVLATIILETKKLYDNSGIPILDEHTIDNDKLMRLFPSFDKPPIVSTSVDDIRDYCRDFMVKFIEAIEDQFYLIRDYDHRTMKLGIQSYQEFIEETTENIEYYTTLGLEAAQILHDYNLVNEAGAVKATLNELNDPELIYQSIMDGNHFSLLNNVIRSHAILKGVNYSGDVWELWDMPGHEISWVMDLADNIKQNENIIMDIVLSDQDRLIIPLKDKLSYNTGGVKIRKLIRQEDNWKYFVARSLDKDDQFDFNMNYVRAPFFGLAEKLICFGVSYQHAKAIVDYLSMNRLEHLKSDNKTRQAVEIKNPEDNKAILKQIDKGDRRVVDLFSIYLSNITGINPNSAKYKFYGTDEEALKSDGISAISIVTKLKDDGIEIIHEGGSKLDSQRELELTSSKFSDDGYDVYTGVNSGVCFIFDFDATGFIFIPDYSIIETREVYEKIKEVNRLAYKSQSFFLNAHEFTHDLQVDSRLHWRYASGVVNYWVLDHLKTLDELDKLDKEIPDKMLSSNRIKGKTYRETLQKIHYLFSLQALGEGKKAEEMRIRGPYQAIWNHGIVIDLDATTWKDKIDLWRVDVPLEDSLAAEYSREVKELLETKDIDPKRVEELYQKNKAHAIELLQMIETMAESIGLYATRDYLNTITKPEIANKYFESIFRARTRLTNFTNIFLEQAQSSESEEELNEALASHGLKHIQFIGKAEYTSPLKETLIDLGYNPLDPLEAYDDLDELEKRAKKNGIDDVSDLYYPVNCSTSLIEKRYGEHIPDFFAKIEECGPKKATEIFLNAESISEVLNS